MNTLPERLVAAIKGLVAAHDALNVEVEEFAALSKRIRSELDRLAPRRERLDTISIDPNGIVKLPRAIQPNAPADSPEEKRSNE